jgi:hypothetical protein
VRQARHDDVQAVAARRDVETRLPLAEDRLLDEEDAPPLGEAAQQVLRPLVDEVPAQVREADEVRLPVRLHARNIFIRPEGFVLHHSHPCLLRHLSLKKIIVDSDC